MATDAMGQEGFYSCYWECMTQDIKTKSLQPCMQLCEYSELNAVLLNADV